MKTEKLTYEVDPHNRLIVRKTGRASGVTGFRKVLDGRFSIAEDNLLTYHIKKSSDFQVPQQIKLSGKYSLDKNHNLVITLNKWNNQVEGNRLIISSKLLDARDDELSFSINTSDNSGKFSTYILKFSGAWQADEYNRLSFNITKTKGSGGCLTLEGGWQVNDNNQIIYSFSDNTLTFKGYWDTLKKHRISYTLNKGIKSRFDFKADFAKISKDGFKYKIGIGAVPVTKTFMLFGEWKLNENIGLLFEMPSEAGKVKSICFGAVCKLSKNNTLDFKLKDNLHKSLDMELKLSRQILDGRGEAFIEALKKGKELSLVSGAGFRW